MHIYADAPSCERVFLLHFRRLLETVLRYRTCCLYTHLEDEEPEAQECNRDYRRN